MNKDFFLLLTEIFDLCATVVICLDTRGQIACPFSACYVHQTIFKQRKLLPISIFSGLVRSR